MTWTEPQLISPDTHGVVAPWLFNMGSPNTRRQEERLSGSLYGSLGGDGGAKLSPSLSAGIDFKKNVDPVGTIYKVLRKAGYSSPEELKDTLHVPLFQMLCVPSINVPLTALPTSRRQHNLFLLVALILGLCTATYYDPSRPVIWTQTSVTRKIRLFTLGDYYASA